MNLKYVGGYVTRDGKFFEDREIAELHEAELEFIEMYNKSGHHLMHYYDANSLAVIVSPEVIHNWITTMPEFVLQQFQAMVKDLEYIPRPEDNDE